MKEAGMPVRAALPGQAPAKPWYRERWPWLLIAGPAIAVIGGIVTVWLAVRTDDGVIADDYYKRGLLINKDLARAKRGEAMRLEGVLAVEPSGALRLSLTGFGGDATAPDAVRVRLVHATRAGLDRTVMLARAPDGVYVGTVDPPPPGRWRVTVETDAWRLPVVEVGGALDRVELGTPRAAN
jgi:hypothetical protein